MLIKRYFYIFCISISIKIFYIYDFIGFLTLPTAYVTGNPVECVLHPSLWNESGVWDAVGVGQMPIGNDDAEYEEENIGYPVSSVSYILFMFISS